MKIYCKQCGVYLGEIRDANLALKKIVFLCKKCYGESNQNTPKNPIPNPFDRYSVPSSNDAIKNMFGGIFK